MLCSPWAQFVLFSDVSQVPGVMHRGTGNYWMNACTWWRSILKNKNIYSPTYIAAHHSQIWAQPLSLGWLILRGAHKPQIHWRMSYNLWVWQPWSCLPSPPPSWRKRAWRCRSILSIKTKNRYFMRVVICLQVICFYLPFVTRLSPSPLGVL